MSTMGQEADTEAARKKKKSTTDIVPLTQPVNGGDGFSIDDFTEIKPGYEQIVELLAELDDVEYDRCRKAKAIEWDVRLDTLDTLRKQARRVREYRQKPKQPEPDPSDLEEKIRSIFDTEGILDLWIQDWDKVIAGEHHNAKMLYLSATSRLFARESMHVAIKGPSGGGKSGIRKTLLKFFPEEDVISFTTLAEKTLLWYKGDFPHKILSLGEATGIQEQSLQDMLLRELMSENILRYPVPQLINGRVVTTEIVKHGPVVFMVTTTRPTLHSENETRTLSLEIDDSVAQTRRVIQKQSQTVGLNSFPTETIYHRWQDFQRLLRILGNKRPGGCWEVTVPFAPALGAIILPKATRFRRDYVQILVAIKAHALLHCYRRETNERGEIVADLELDYLPIAKLMESAACEAVGITADKYVRQTAEAVKIATINMQPDEGATGRATA
jgi:hypothetical protein